jgi:surface protein
MTNLTDLTDVTITAPQDGERLVYEDGFWINKPLPEPEPWTRPADWLAIEELESTEQKFVGLMAITDDDANFAAFTAAGAYTVDWGDGTVEDYASGATALHLYDYAAIDNATLSSRGYKQVIVTVTPQAGQNLTALNLNIRHTQAGLQAYETGWLDIEVGSPNLSASGLVIGGAETVRRRWLERVRIANFGNQTTCAGLFQNCPSLQSVPLFNTSAVTNISFMFNNCTSLQSVPLFNTSAVTNIGGMFQSCPSLQSVPLFNTSAVTNMGSMFRDCVSLQSVPLFNTSAVTNISLMFFGCFSLQSVPAFDVSAVSSSANFGSMFVNCNSLSKMQATGFNFTFSLASCKLSGPQLDAIYTALPTVSGQTITVTGNWGTATHDPTIATAKGWTVTA